MGLGGKEEAPPSTPPASRTTRPRRPCSAHSRTERLARAHALGESEREQGRGRRGGRAYGRAEGSEHTPRRWQRSRASAACRVGGGRGIHAATVTAPPRQPVNLPSLPPGPWALPPAALLLSGGKRLASPSPPVKWRRAVRSPHGQ